MAVNLVGKQEAVGKARWLTQGRMTYLLSKSHVPGGQQMLVRVTRPLLDMMWVVSTTLLFFPCNRLKKITAFSLGGFWVEVLVNM